MRPIGIYVHIPFCRSKCGYCDFYSLTKEEYRHAYVERVIEEIRTYAGKGITADTLFIGGGTPSLLSLSEVEQLVTTCREVFSLQGEIAMEANPDSVTPVYLQQLHQIGINRISFGAQSGVDLELQALGRRHNRQQIADAVCWAREAEFDNLSLDVMLGIPYQTEKSLQETLNFMCDLQPEHLSCYLLKIEEGTPFYRQHAEKLCVDADCTADFYLQTIERLEANGYQQYEISNFAKSGCQSRHNLKYWHCEEYLGFGAAAHSFFEGKRFYHSSSVAEYLSDRCFALCPDGEGGSEEERVLLQLRLTEGLDLTTLPQPMADQLLSRSKPYQNGNLMQLTEHRLSFTSDGFLVSNSILAELLSD